MIKIELLEDDVAQAVRQYAAAMLPSIGYKFEGVWENPGGGSPRFTVTFSRTTPLVPQPDLLVNDDTGTAVEMKPGEFNDGIPEPTPRQKVEFLKSVSGGMYAHSSTGIAVSSGGEAL